MTEIVTTLLEQYRHVIEHLRNHISECVDCKCKFIDVLSSLDLEDKKNSAWGTNPNTAETNHLTAMKGDYNE